MSEQKCMERCLICGQVFYKTAKNKKSDYCSDCEAKMGGIKPQIDKPMFCPFCGKTGPVGVFNENQLNYVSKSDKNYKENPYYAVVCDITVCGCGGSGGFRRSPKEAILAWNNRVLTKGGE